MPSNAAQNVSLRDAFGDAILELGEKNKDIVVLTADLSESTRVSQFEKKFPERFVQAGVAEQNMAGIAAGLSFAGKIPFMTSFSVFSPEGNLAQIRTSIAYSEANVKIIGTHAGLSAGLDGATHQALEDISLMRTLPGTVVLSPVDALETKKAVAAAVEYKGPVYIRLFREPTPLLTSEKDPFEIGKATLLKEGSDLTIIGCGPILANVLEATGNISCDVINCSSLKPVDKEAILKSARKTKRVVTVEEHQIIGGLGSMIAELTSSEFPVPVMRIGVEDKFGESGTYQELLEKYGLSAQKISERIKGFLNV